MRSLVLNRDLVERVPIFSKFSADEFIKIIQQLRPVTYLPGEYIVKQGEDGESMYFIKRGRVDVLVTMTLEGVDDLPALEEDRKTTGRRGSGLIQRIQEAVRRDSTSSQSSQETSYTMGQSGPAASDQRVRRMSFNGWTNVGGELKRTSIVATLKGGDFFGESALLSGARRNASCRAVDYVDVLTLSKQNFEDVTSSKEVVNEMRAVAIKRRKDIAEIRRKESNVYATEMIKRKSARGKGRNSNININVLKTITGTGSTKVLPEEYVDRASSEPTLGAWDE